MNQQQTEYQEVVETIDVPKHTGVEGFILAIRGVLRMPRVVNLSVDARGKVTYTRYARKEEPRKNIDINFESVAPGAIIRNGQVHELDLESFQNNAAASIAAVFQRAAKDKMYPVGWVVGADTFLFSWHKLSTGVELPDDTVYGLPVYRDRHVPDEALLLACAYGPDAALIDTQMAYKVLIPNRPAVTLPSEDNVEVLQ